MKTEKGKQKNIGLTKKDVESTKSTLKALVSIGVLNEDVLKTVETTLGESVKFYDRKYNNVISLRFIQFLEYLKSDLGIDYRTSCYNIGLHETALSNMRSSKANPMFYHVANAVKIYKLSLNWFFFGEGEMIQTK